MRWISQMRAKMRPAMEAGRRERQVVQAQLQSLQKQRDTRSRLRASNERFRAIVSATSQIVWTRDANGNFVKPQPSWSTFTGQSFDQLRGHGWVQAIHPDDREQVGKAWQRVLQTGGLFEAQGRLRRHDGEYRMMMVRGVPILESDGRVREWIGTNTDITEREKAADELRESQLQFQSLANSIPQLSWMADETGHIFWYNQRWYDYTGTTFEEMEGWGWKKVHHPEHLDSVLESWSQSLQTQQPWEHIFPLRSKNGEYGWFLSRAQPVRDENGRVVRWFGTNTDITRDRQAEAQLRQSEARKAAILETALDCIIAIDHDSHITEWNPAAEKTFGWTREEALGQHLPELIIPPALREAHYNGLKHYLASGEGPVLGQRIEVPALRKDGREITIELAITRIAGEGLPLFSAYLRDITERKKSEADLAAHARLSSLAADVGLALNQSDTLDDILQSCSEAIVQHLDAAFARIWTLNELENTLELQSSAGMYTHLDGPHGVVPVGQFKIGLIAQERLPHLTNEVVGDERVADQEWARREGMIAFAGYPLMVEGRMLGVMAMFARHALSPDVLRSLSTVADAVALGIKRKKAEADLEKARAVAEEASRAKSLFLANMSHELRTPLNAILGYSEMLGEEAAELELEDFVPDLERINSAGKHLLALINDILDLSKIEAGKMELFVESFDVGAMIEDVASTLQRTVEKNGNTLRIEYSNLGEMQSDGTKVRQCLLNLLANAAKFTQNGQITLEAHRERMESLDEKTVGREWMVFQVTDSGIGMSAEQVVKLFQSFAQADASTTRKFGGTGLGLALTRRFTQMMGGDVSVQSESEKGSTFTIKIPARADASHADALENENTESAETPSNEKVHDQPSVEDALSAATEAQSEDSELLVGRCVLVIDDDAAQRELMRRFLEKEGFPSQTAAGGEEGLRLARQLKPVAITLDVMMPGVDGWSVLTTLKADAELRDIPVIMLTMVDDKNRGYALGAADYITKPVDRARLSHILEKYVCCNPPCPVLLIEDDEMTRHMMRQMLEREGWTVDEAPNGREALEVMERNRPELILLDLMMPEMDGFDFTAQMHARAEWRSIPIIVLTAKELTADDRLRLNGYVQKVLQKTGQSPEELMRQVRDLVAKCALPQNSAASEAAPPKSE